MIVRSCSWRVMLIMVLVTPAVAGCSKDPGQAASPTGATSSSPSADLRRHAEGDALAAYTGMWMAMAKATETSNPDDPQLRRYATGDALALIVGSLAADKGRGVVTKGQPTLNPEVAAATPKDVPVEVSIVDCGSDAGWVKYTQNGELADDVPGGNRRITATVKVVDGTWKVVKAKVGEVGSC